MKQSKRLVRAKHKARLNRIERAERKNSKRKAGPRFVLKEMKRATI